MRTTSSIAVIVLLSWTQLASAWGASGHAIVAEIAQRRLDPTASQGVAELLGPGSSLASVASWADDERSRDRTTSRWHYVDIPSSETTYDPSRDCASDPEEGDCIIAEIARETATVACPTAALIDRQRALKFLVHFVGDLHQPLHTIEDQRGGNGIAVTITTRQGVNGNTPFNTNLHAAWDAAMIDKTEWSWGGYVERLEKGWLQTREGDPSSTEGTPIDWTEQSHAVAVDLIHSVPANIVLDDSYRTGHLDILDQQLGLAGLRLAHVLNNAFAAEACPD